MSQTPEYRARVRGSPEPISQLLEPPKNFNPVQASPTDLIKYGFPPRPDKKIAPIQYAKWYRAVSRARKFIAPRSNRNAKPEVEENAGWSGALLKTPPTPFSSNKEVSIWSASASYIIPNPYPPPTGATDKVPYKVRNWVGFDGYSVSSCYRAGSTSQVIKSGDNLNQTAVPFFEWVNTDPVGGERREYPDLNVKPGDVLTVFVFGIVGSNRVNAFLLNVGSGEFTSDSFTNGPALEGTSAEWITEALLSPAGQKLGFADYGVTFFYDILALNFVFNPEAKNFGVFDLFKVYTVDDATILDITATSTAERPKDVLLLYAYENQPIIS